MDVDWDRLRTATRTSKYMSKRGSGVLNLDLPTYPFQFFFFIVDNKFDEEFVALAQCIWGREVNYFSDKQYHEPTKKTTKVTL